MEDIPIYTDVHVFHREQIRVRKCTYFLTHILIHSDRRGSDIVPFVLDTQMERRTRSDL